MEHQILTHKVFLQMNEKIVIKIFCLLLCFSCKAQQQTTSNEDAIQSIIEAHFIRQLEIKKEIDEKYFPERIKDGIDKEYAIDVTKAENDWFINSLEKLTYQIDSITLTSFFTKKDIEYYKKQLLMDTTNFASYDFEKNNITYIPQVKYPGEQIVYYASVPVFSKDNSNAFLYFLNPVCNWCRGLYWYRKQADGSWEYHKFFKYH